MGSKLFKTIFQASLFICLKFFVINAVLNEPSNLEYSPAFWEDCWQQQQDLQDISGVTEGLGTCLKHKLYINLAESSGQQCIDVGDGVQFLSSEEEGSLSPRDIFPEGIEPSTMRELAESYSKFLGRRGIRWDLGYLYPGLVMRVGPTLSGRGIVEFDMNRHVEYYQPPRLSPGQEVIRRTLLPHLLGFRMNVMTLLPLMFGILVYVAKNAFIFSKITLVISTLLALKSLFFLQHLRHPHSLADSSVGASEQVAFEGPLGGPRPQPHSLRPSEVILQMFTAALPPFRGVNDRPAHHHHHPPDLRGIRNFSWQ